METLAVLSDRDLVDEFLEGLRELSSGDTIDAADLEAKMCDAGRFPDVER